MAIQRRRPLLSSKRNIEEWVKAGRSDEWIAAALGTSASSIQSFRSRRGIYRTASVVGRPPELASAAKLADAEPSVVCEGVLEHGGDDETGVGVWLDPSVSDDPAWQARWNGHAAVKVVLTPTRMVILRDEAAPDAGQDSPNGFAR